MISADDIRHLLDTDGSVLVVVAGHAEVVDVSALGEDRLRGALQVVSHDDLADRIGSTELSDRELAEQAEALYTAVAELGG